jgi:phosphopantothenoylcysteine decarboxylase
MANVLLGVTGSVAAIYTPQLHDDLAAAGHEVKVLATGAAIYFFDPCAIASLPDRQRNRQCMLLDEDEWPGSRYRRGDSVLHIELRRWADVLLIAPLDANTLAKLALGITDNALTCVYRAWQRERPVVLAPAMNTLMWEHPATLRHLRQIAADLGVPDSSPNHDRQAWIEEVNAKSRRFRIVSPVTKKLACEDEGIGAMASRDQLLRTLCEVL